MRQWEEHKRFTTLVMLSIASSDDGNHDIGDRNDSLRLSQETTKEYEQLILIWVVIDWTHCFPGSSKPAWTKASNQNTKTRL
mmetsp:Transcript_6900/g.12442  ORF Transcript_6900/g.12442 Transcript_6900/m.12442 type:complete len:82 (-) Transcript_6900:791-1036(-)